MTLREVNESEAMIEVEVNCPDTEAARRIACSAVAGGLAACANILPGVESVYLWQGAMETGPEVALRLKSHRGCFDELCSLIIRLHPYDLPAIVALPVLVAGPGYRDWLIESTGGHDQPPAGDL